MISKLKTNKKLLDLLAKSVEEVRNMTPEEKNKMLEAQRKSWVRGNIGWDDTKYD